MDDLRMEDLNKGTRSSIFDPLLLSEEIIREDQWRNYF